MPFLAEMVFKMNKVSRIIIDPEKNNWFLYLKDGSKYVGSELLGIRQIFKSETYRKDLPIVISQISDVIDDLNNK